MSQYETFTQTKTRFHFIFISMLLQGCVTANTQIQVANETNPVATTEQSLGLPKASISVTESYQSYEYNLGRVAWVSENYDDKFKTTNINLLSPESPLHPLTFKMAPNQPFYLLLVNGNYNSGAYIQINDKRLSFSQYAMFSNDFLRGDLTALPILYPTKLKTLKILIDKDSAQKGTIVKSRLDCVATNYPGPNSEYRNAAPTLQAIPISHNQFDPFTKAADHKSKILYELSFFINHPTCL